MTSDVVDAPRSASAEHLRTEIAAALTEVMAQWDAREVDATKRAGFLLGDFTDAACAVFEAEAADLRSEGDEARGYEWATRALDGTRSRWQDEACARKVAGRHPHLGLDCREVRHFVGRWREVDATAVLADHESSGASDA
jgi:hypothetical protein